jgi:tyrosine-protein kinase Etk/Wzc
MNSPDSQLSEVCARRGADEIDFVDILIFFAKYKRIVLGIPVLVAFITAAISLILPNVYKATVKLLPPQQSQSAGAILTQLSGAAGLAAGMVGLKNPSDMYVGMLQSRTIADRLIARFNLQKLYDVDYVDQARDSLDKDTDVTAGKDGLITIEVESKDRSLVARLANGYVEELIGLSNTLALTEASQRRVFFERQLQSAKASLAAAEASMKRIIDTKGVVNVDSDSRAVLEMTGRLRARISAKEIELDSMRAFLTDKNPDYLRGEEELRSLKAELGRLENGRDRPAQGANQVEDSRGLENIKVLRDVKYYQMLYELLAKQYEGARLDEAKDSSIIQVVDIAVEPERRYKPKRAVLVLVATFAAFVFSVVFAYVLDAKAKLVNVPEGAARWARLKAYLRFAARDV